MSERQAMGENGRDRRDMMGTIVVVSTFMIILVFVTLLAFYQPSNKDDTTIRDTFNVLLPVLGSWVGMVLTFYFSDRTQERLNTTLTNAIGKQAPEQQKISSIMKKMTEIRGIQEIGHKDDKEFSSKSIVEFFKSFESRPGEQAITRKIITDTSKNFLYIFHLATLKSFLVDYQLGVLDQELGITRREDHIIDVKHCTIHQFLSIESYRKLVSDKVVFVPENTSLGVARDLLKQSSGAEDIIITTNGQQSGAMIGWLSDVDLLKALRAD